MKGAQAPRKPAATRRTKASCASECRQLVQIPNIGPAMAADFRSLGINSPQDLTGCDPLALYQQLCRSTGQRHDPCVLDTFMAAIDFMNGAAARDWWSYTAQRKKQYPDI